MHEERKQKAQVLQTFKENFRHFHFLIDIYVQDLKVLQVSLDEGIFKNG